MTRPAPVDRDRDGDRDRDQDGRPRNARPRDGLGRPLDRAATGEPLLPDDLRLTPDDAVLAAQRMIDDGRPFHAHEVLEAAWKTAPAGQRDLWQGLAQIAVGLTHARRGNSRGAVALLRRGAAGVAGHLGGPAGGHGAAAAPRSLDPAAARRAALDLADLIERAGLTGVTENDLLLRLTPPEA